MPDNQVRSVTAKLRADFTQYDTATAKSAQVTKKATGEMASAAKKAAGDIEASAKKISAAEQQAAKDIQKAAAAAEKAATRESAAAEKAAAREQTASKKATAAAERAQARKAAAAEKAADREAAAAKKSAAEQERAARRVAAAEKAAAREAKRSADERHAAMGELGTTLGMTSAAVLAATALAVKGYADFESQMSRVSAAMDADAASMDKLKVAALEAGKATKYSATEAAVAEEELAKAGLSVAEIVGGGLTAAMSLAAAGNMELGDSAELAANAMKTFSMNASEVPLVADALAAGAGKAVGSVQQMGYALKMSGLVANQLGMSLTDTVGTLAAFAQNALLGSDAGTSLKTMLAFLQPKSAAAASAMKELGLDFYDAQGQFVGITNVAGQLQEKLSGLTQEQRMSTMFTIFGSDAIRAANVLYKEGAQGIQTWIDAVEDQGYAARQAAKAQDNLRGDIEKLGGAIETSLIEAGAGGAGGLRMLTQEATKAVDAFASLPSGVSHTVTVIGLAAGVTGLAAAGFLKVVPAIVETKAAMAALNITAATTRSRLGGIARFVGGPWGAALALGTIALDTWIERQHQAAESSRQLREALDQQTGAVTGAARKVIQDQLSARRPGSEVLPDWLLRGEDTRSINERAKSIGLSLSEIQVAAEGNGPAMTRLKQQMAAAFAAGDQRRIQELGYILQFLGDSANEVGKQRQAIQLSSEAMDGLGESAEATAGGVNRYSDAMAGATEATEEQEEALQGLKDALDASNNLFLTGREAARNYESALDEASAAAKKNGETLKDGTEKGRANAEALDALAKAGLEHLQVMVDQGEPQAKFNRAMAETRADLIRTAEKFGMSKKAATAYADKIYDLPRRAVTEIYLKNAAAAKKQAKDLYSAVRSLPMKKTITLTVREVYENYGGESAARARWARAGTFARAEGGKIPASAGTPGKDSVPALLMPEEYVVKAREARRHLPLLEAINAGRLPGYATGGQVGARAAAPMASSSPQVVMVPVQQTHTTAATVHVGTVLTQDARSFVGWGQRRSFDATAGIR